MRDPFSWSLPLGRLFGITVRVHILFPLFALGLILRVAFQKDPEPIPGTWIDVAVLMGLLALCVLFHEFGHCLAARWVDGEATEVLLWPLGGLAQVEVPQTPRATFLVAAAGPAVNLLLCGCCLLALLIHDPMLRPSVNPIANPYRQELENPATAKFEVFQAKLYTWRGDEAAYTNSPALVVLARLFYLNWILALLNICLIGFPLDGGVMFQSILWRYFGYRQATLAAVFVGFVFMLVVCLAAIIMKDLLPLFLAGYIYIRCRQQWILLETGGEESLFGYDFSQGYTSLEREHPAAPPARRRPNWFQRWSQRRAARKLLLEQEQREAEERRMDELLEKVQAQGLHALTEEEQRFLKRVSARYRNRH